MEWYEIIGWFGVVAILLAYAGVSFSILMAADWLYFLLNGSGAFALMVQSFMRKNIQVCILNFVWTLIAIVGVITLLLQ